MLGSYLQRALEIPKKKARTKERNQVKPPILPSLGTPLDAIFMSSSQYTLKGVCHTYSPGQSNAIISRYSKRLQETQSPFRLMCRWILSQSSHNPTILSPLYQVMNTFFILSRG